MWLDGGTRMVIIVNPRRRLVTIYRLLHTISLLRADQVLDGADVVPGWSLPVHEIFAEI